MIEFVCDELDEDYITIWSRMLLKSEDASKERDLIEKLAELGQVNAIQKWYQIKNKTDVNKKIDNIVDSLADTFFWNKLAIMYKKESLCEQKVISIVEDLQKLYDQQYRLYALFKINEAQDLDKDIFYLENEFKNHSNFELFTSTVEEMKMAFNNHKNYLIVESLLEEFGNCFAISNKYFSTTRKKLTKEFAVCKTPQYAFALAKHLNMFYVSCLKGKTDRAKKMATTILQELAERKLSNKLIDYVNATKNKNNETKNEV